VSKGAVNIYRPGPRTVAFDLVGAANLVLLERSLLDLERRAAERGSVVEGAFARIHDVTAITGGPTFVRFARAFLERTPSFRRVALHAVRSFVVRTIVDPIALASPGVTFRTFGDEASAIAFAREIDPEFDVARLPPLR
jgi:hypothetical protein